MEIVDEEYDKRKSNRLKMLIRKAQYVCPEALLEDVDYRADRQLDKTLITRLGICAYIRARRNIIITGATGSGKTYLSCALGNATNREFMTVRYIRLPETLGELAVSRNEGTYAKVLMQFVRVNLLILDDWLLYELREAECRELMEVMLNCCERASTIFCSQYEVPGWRDRLGNGMNLAVADAILDRIVSASYDIPIKGDESMRKLKGPKDDD